MAGLRVMQGVCESLPRGAPSCLPACGPETCGGWLLYNVKERTSFRAQATRVFPRSELCVRTRVVASRICQVRRDGII